MDQIEFDNILCALVSETDINKIESVSQKLVDLSRCSEVKNSYCQFRMFLFTPTFKIFITDSRFNMDK